MTAASLVVAAALTVCPHLAAAHQSTGAQVAAPPATGTAALGVRAPADSAAALTFANREITVFRASLLSRSPEERAAAAVQQIDAVLDSGTVGPVTVRPFEGTMVAYVGARDVFVLFPADADELIGETLESKATQAAATLQTALDEAVELRTPRRMLISGAEAAAATVIFILVLWLGRRAQRRVATWFMGVADRQMRRLPGTVVHESRLPAFMRWIISLVSVAASLVVTYVYLTFLLRRFPFTRPWGESLRTQLLGAAASVAESALHAVPGLAMVVVIVIVARFVNSLLRGLLDAAGRDQIVLPFVYPETVTPTKRIVTTVVWLFALIVAYPYLPGSGTDAFKGVSVFVGVAVSLGSSGLTNQIMSGFSLTYSRAIRLGEFVKIGDLEGTVKQIGILSTKLVSIRGEELTIPNAVVLATTTTNYSRLAADNGVFLATTVTIGYDAPWRQVRDLLLLAAERTPGLRAEPKPKVRQAALQDFYVEYTLLVATATPERRADLLSALNANIQDAFNEYGVQILSPHYENDPVGGAKIVVPKAKWFQPPTTPE